MITMTSTAMARNAMGTIITTTMTSARSSTVTHMITITRNMVTRTLILVTGTIIPMDLTTTIYTIMATATIIRPGSTIRRMRPISIGAPCPASAAR